MAGIYIHIPFCKQACSYCNFHFSTLTNTKDNLVNALLKEIELQKDYLKGEKIETVYFGGGTPSLLKKKDIESILDQLSKTHRIEKSAEITLEANPDDLNSEKLKDLKSLGINRLSIGVQSFFDEDLKFMKRAHTSKEAYQSIQRAQEIGLNNISIDLIYGVPTLSSADWIKNLESFFSLNLQHLSAYCLTVEPRTFLNSQIKKAKIKELSEDKATEQFQLLINLTRKNEFIQYEISNFAKQQNYSIHNTNYWKNKSYLGLGPSAHSYNGISRQWNIANNNKYIESINKGIVPFEKEDLTEEMRFNEYILTCLRTVWGINKKTIEENFGKDILDKFMSSIEKYINTQHILYDHNSFSLTDKGKLFADKISSDLFIYENKHTLQN